jgi:hypothetical protein
MAALKRSVAAKASQNPRDVVRKDVKKTAVGVKAESRANPHSRRVAMARSE